MQSVETEEKLNIVTEERPALLGSLNFSYCTTHAASPCFTLVSSVFLSRDIGSWKSSLRCV